MLQNLIRSRGITLTYVHAFCLIIKVTDATSKKNMGRNSKQHRDKHYYLRSWPWAIRSSLRTSGPAWHTCQGSNHNPSLAVRPWAGDVSLPSPQLESSGGLHYRIKAWQKGGSQASAAISLDKLLSQRRDHHDPTLSPAFFIQPCIMGTLPCP